ncbi:amidohydrolase family protein [Pseudolysinimonas yzui]|uniref:4-hydroxyphenyl-beta-ketoacyl-CoA hydrolase n=1 Tax=Pseudolysinimonas yzui TaxID=2708254 RepID=A0A8J3GR31_9MICO|nr:amidohydrolase family protein [Pseudolysinimonas yzui]GHF19279.1 4-hydroxyphenyl-beta-ketoacyl-CoA hydrolase [Pseudolysinimonas yzui]
MTERYEPRLDIESLDALDVHVHIEIDDHGHLSLPDALAEAAAKYFKSDGLPTLDAIADLYRELKSAAVVFTVDARTGLGHQPIDSAEIARGATRNADVLIPFGSVDPRTGADAVELARRLVEDSGVRGFKLHPTVQGFDPSDEAYYPLYAEFSRLGVPMLVHTGQTGIGAGTRGGGGFRLGYSNPMLLDGVAGDFPDLDIVFAHPSVPWQDEALSIATHKSNVWIDLSGWSPKYFPENLVRAARSYLQDRVLFGSDYPVLHPTRWRDDFAAHGLDEKVTRKILRDNAIRLLGL